MTSPARKQKAKRAAKLAKAGLKRKNKTNREGSTASAEKLFAVQAK